jgi:tRNA-Thr(GGU) m(6)t(6)A37 methyltransferase TsaA
MMESASQYRLIIIGKVESSVKTQTDEGWGAITSRVALSAEFRPGLDGLECFSHAIIVTWLHQATFVASRDLRRRPRGLDVMPEIGIFAQRAKNRPNPLGLTVVTVVELQPDGMVVRGLDAIDGTPVVDIKPYFPQYDRADGAIVPDWVNNLMRGYFA